MELSLSEVESIAKLCRIKLTAEETNNLQHELQNIFDYFSDLDALDTAGVEPTGWAIQDQSVLRQDIISDSMNPADVLSNAPDTDNTFIKVRRVLN
jgi:aspartyl-tRNA(Asn)/glutamyl-tRNA(Gln) amidotransferase subunit C